MTFSVAGICQDTGMVGCAITSSSICVASRCAYTRSGVGVALSQNVTNPDLGPLALHYMAQGCAPDEVLKYLQQADRYLDWRQVGVLDAQGRGITFSGKEALGINATRVGQHCLAMGNLLASTHVPDAMIDAFEHSTGHLAERLLIALEAGLKAGGEMGPVFSAGLQVSAEPDWPVVDLRVDWHVSPIHELRMVWEQYQPQIDDYVKRAKQPADASAFGVPGNE
ncbi:MULTISPECIES: DUF1028 domain-containing protein [Oceanospirillaceae]|uniref:DUF1028 domain-containing protein n=1 Tax=Oceanobacter antarcticus TaxID=3133425 RepID=A0ABW8NJP5_9GAMM|tara:strand:+ start:4695 stop:5366 length:672 start_codon:yes stop_codon:yes gene_type:complete